VRPRAGEALVRLAVREGMGPQAPELPTSPLSYSSLAPSPITPPPSLERSTLMVDDGDVSPGWDSLGSLTLSASVSHTTNNDEGAVVQTSNSFVVGGAYRRLVQDIHMTFKLEGEMRLHDAGQPSQWAGFEAFFMHPQHRQIRLQGFLYGYSQPVDGQ